MSSPRLLLASSLIIFCFHGPLLAQDYSGFFRPFGFQLPPLRSGQAAFSLASQYQSIPSGDSVWSAPTLDIQATPRLGPAWVLATQNSSGRATEFGLTTLYGLNDEITLSVDLTMLPRQETSNLAGQTVYMRNEGPYGLRAYSFGVVGHSHQSGNSARALASYRPSSRWELSFGGYFASLRLPSVGMQGTRKFTTVYSPLAGFSGNSPWPFEAASSYTSRDFGLQGGVAFLSDTGMQESCVLPAWFELPMLSDGQYAASAAFHYDRHPIDRLDRTEFFVQSDSYNTYSYAGDGSVDAASTLSRAAAQIAYGLTEKSSAALRIDYAPIQETRVSTMMQNYRDIHGQLTATYANSALDTAAILVEAKLAHRLTQGLELSSNVMYRMSKSTAYDSSITYGVNPGSPVASLANQISEATNYASELAVGAGATMLSDPAEIRRYIPVSGFLLPLLHSGQFMVSGHVTFSIETARSDFALQSFSPKGNRRPISHPLSATRRFPILSFESAFISGISNDLTVSGHFLFAPHVVTGSRASVIADQVTNPNLISLRSGTIQGESWQAEAALAYRLFSGMEISLSGFYRDVVVSSSQDATLAFRTMEFTYPQTPGYSEYASNRVRQFTVHMGIAMLLF